MHKTLTKYYKNFERPPFAPTYCPSEEEFADPISYVAKIKPEAEKYGVVKIKPPPSFRPPFAIDSERFEFTPRVQKLNQVEGTIRSRLIFESEITNYWHLQGHVMQQPVLENRHVDLFRLSRVVAEAGGAAAISEQKRWPQIAKQLGFKGSVGSRIRDIHAKWIFPYEKSLREEIEQEEEPKPGTAEECFQATQGRRKAPEPRTRMMAGVRAPAKEKKVKVFDPMDDVVCKKCGNGDDEKRLLLCEDCDYALHIYCCDPPLSGVPKAEWRCRKCAVTVVKGIADTFGFHDAHTKYNLITFAEYANEWKRNYFNQNPLEVLCEEVENEFWRKVIDLETVVAVKYGADLMASKVGSGFPMPNDDFSGCIDSKEREYYSRHPWNLNNLPILEESVLSHMESGISGMMVPWVYVGMCFSTFCWHTEDHWTYSVNYLHWGERKIWYGVSGLDGGKFDDVMKGIVPELFEKQPDLLHHMTTTVNPRILINKGIKVYTVHQEAGEYVITFPRAYHAGYNEGLNFAEAVNFAPADWLRRGRLCVLDYASVRRNCVFSQDELIMRMAKNTDKLSIGMCVALYEEMYELCQREARLRQRVQEMGVYKFSLEEYEKIADDLRTCAVCRTTVFLSALQCIHGRLVCLEHSDRLCSKCSPKEFILKYRYTLDDLAPVLKDVAEHISAYTEWKEKMESMLESKNGGKPTLDEIRSMIDMARLRSLPHCDLLERAILAVKQCEQTSQSVHALLTRKMRTRNKGRSSAAEKPEISDVKDLFSSINRLPCAMPELNEALQKYVDRVNNWKKRTADVLETDVDVDKGTFNIDLIRSLIDEAEDFNVNLPEVEKLEQLLCRCQWFVCAEKLLNWNKGKKNDADQETDIDDEDSECSMKGKWRLQDAMKIVNEGSRIMEGNPVIQKMVNLIHAMMKIGYQNEYAAESFLSDEGNEGIGLDEALKRWAAFEKSDWVNEENINRLRVEVDKAKKIHACLLRAKEGEDYTLKDFEEMRTLCEESFFIRNSETHKEVCDLYDRAQCFTKRVSQMFVRNTSYYSLFEILNGRDDLASLMEGAPMTLSIYTSKSYADDWAGLENFDSAEQLITHLRHVNEQQLRLMKALRLTNGGRSLAETCYCGLEKAEEQAAIVCLLCRAKYHVGCARWDASLSRLPPGYYLCVRCVRGRRPFVEDVGCACTLAPPSLERAMVSYVLDCGVSAFKSAVDVITTIPNSSDGVEPAVLERLDACIVAVLCSEVTDYDAWRIIAEKIPLIWSVSDSERALCEEMRSRPVDAQPPTVLFSFGTTSQPKKTKRSSNAFSKNVAGGSQRKRIRNIFHNDKEPCSAELCLKPYSNHVRWIQCEAGCSRWYHYICVGQTVSKASEMQSYCCYRCCSKADTLVPVSIKAEDCQHKYCPSTSS